MIRTDGKPTVATPNLRRLTCVDCNGNIAPALLRLGSLRCHDCRKPEGDKP